MSLIFISDNICGYRRRLVEQQKWNQNRSEKQISKKQDIILNLQVITKQAPDITFF